MRGALLTLWVQLKACPLWLLGLYPHCQGIWITLITPTHTSRTITPCSSFHGMSFQTTHDIPFPRSLSTPLTSGAWLWSHDSFPQNSPKSSLSTQTSLSVFTFHPRQGMPWFSLVTSVHIRHPFPIQTTNPTQQKYTLTQDLSVSLSNAIPSPINILVVLFPSHHKSH